ncbi:MAG: glycosyltransferase family 2 protein [Solobacterium sp.]|jgi:glycosyltransferase involved in cell wall biosynthesis|nr:glycosyltransferase family 2 protein [Solobacterium sp.]MCH4049502.1 glycosyltransferase family 2 protein [Solobacterium sp.]MCH4075360.1 glycosyltransferase family 2 protein [Solobacterium sp.]
MEKYITECIESIYKEKRDDIQVIVINDGSSDNTYAICNELGKKYSNLELINKKNTGSMDSYIIGIDDAIGEYTCFLDSDDYLEDNYFETLDKYISYNSDILLFDYYKCSKSNKEYCKINAIPYGLINDHTLSMLKDDYFGNYEKYSFYRWNKIYKTSLLKKVRGNINFRVTYFEDLFLELLVLERTNTIYYIKEPLYDYRLRKSSVTHNVSTKVFDDNRLMRSELLKHMQLTGYRQRSIVNMEEYMDYGYIRYYLRSNDKQKRIAIPSSMILKNRHPAHIRLILIYKLHLTKLFKIALQMRNSKSSCLDLFD